MQTEPAAARGPRRPAVAFIFVTVMLDMMTLGMAATVLPKLVESFEGGDTARAAEVYGLFGTVWAVMQFVASPVLGALSDRFGRRPVVLLSNLGLGLDYVLMALAPTLPWLFVGRVISGITAASIPTAFAYITDVTPPDKRAAGFGMLGAAFGVGFVVGPALGGLLGDAHPRLPFWVAAGLSLANALYGLFVLPESLPPERRAPFAWGRANPVGSLTLLRSHPELLGLASTNLLGYLAHQVLPNVFVLYTTYRYGWSLKTVGLSLAAFGVCYGVVQAALMQPVVDRFGERRALLAGLAFGAAGFAVYGLAGTGAVFWAGLPVLTLWGLAAPTAQSLMTRRVGPSEQGQLQGAIGGLRGIAGLLGPGLFTFTFARFIRPGTGLHLPGAPFLLSALLVASSLWLAWRVTRATHAPPSV